MLATRLLLIGLVGFVTIAAGWGLPDAGAARADIERAASAFLDRLDTDLRSRVVFDFDGTERHDWHFIPRAGHGLTMGQLDTEQRRAVHDLLRSALSGAGYLKASGVLQLEELLGRDPDLYRIAFYGAPSADETWSWRIEGHHLSLTITVVPGQGVSVTPAFIGAQPALVTSGPLTGLRLLGGEEDLARALLASLDDTQRARTMIADRAPRDVVMSPGRNDGPDPAGVRYADLRADQRAILTELIQTYAASFHQDLADHEIARITGAGLDDIRFAWAGSATPGEGHYFRVHGPTFVIEYDNVQHNATHIHSIWRDLERDFGEDLLRAHHAAHHADP